MKSIIVAIALLLTASTVQALTMDFEAPLFNFGAGNCVGNNEFCRGSYTENGIRIKEPPVISTFSNPELGELGTISILIFVVTKVHLSVPMGRLAPCALIYPAA